MYRYYGERMHYFKNLWYITLKEKPDNILCYHLYASANTLIIMIFKYPQIENLNFFFGSVQNISPLENVKRDKECK